MKDLTVVTLQVHCHLLRSMPEAKALVLRQLLFAPRGDIIGVLLLLVYNPIIVEADRSVYAYVLSSHVVISPARTAPWHSRSYS